jgi:CDP-6-deoxy-D-xylo-4-hexulose-3-dehydrase
MTESNRAEQLRQQIRELVGEYTREAFAPKAFVPGETPLPVSGRVFDQRELQTLVDSSLDFWLTTGRFAAEFERRFSDYVGVRCASLVNSGSSANLLALSALTSRTLGERRIAPGDEVITVAAGFPTTVNPILQNQAVPVFVDVAQGTWNVDASLLEAALSPRTKALIFAHTLGNPFDLATVSAFAKAHNLWLIEDCCDALGASFGGRMAGTFGDIATFSFYPAHHITMGEGGAVLTDQPALGKLIESFRDWGRDCWCDPGCDNTCHKRFEWQLGKLPRGYDHKYIYSQIGYNLKLTDMQAAVGVAQLDKLEGFIAARRRNFARLRQALAGTQEVYLLPEPAPGGKPSWFGFPLAVRPESGRTRDKIIAFLEQRKIGTRLLFGGNLLRQPAYEHVHCRAAGELPNSDYVMRNVFWVGVYPGLSDAMIDYLSQSLVEAAAQK